MQKNLNVQRQQVLMPATTLTLIVFCLGCNNQATDGEGNAPKPSIEIDAKADTNIIAQDVFGLVNDGKTAKIEKLLQTAQASQLVNIRNKDGMTPLHRASVKGHVDIVRLLINKGADIEATDGRGWTPLHIAAMKGHAQIVELLTQSGAKLDAKDRRGMTPSDWARSQGHDQLVKQLKVNE